MAKYTPVETTETNLRQSYDASWYGHLRGLIRFTLGEPYRANSDTPMTMGGEMPDDLDLIPRYYEPGQSRRILTNTALMMAKVCYMDPDPSYPDLGRTQEIIRKAYNKAVWRGRDYLGPDSRGTYREMGSECHRAFTDGYGLGVGFVQIGVRDGWVTVQHHPITRVLFDRHSYSVSGSRFVAFSHPMPVEDAVRMFGSSIAKYATEDHYPQFTVQGMRAVKLIQIFDMGYDKWTPTETWKLQSIGGQTIDVSENKYECLPFAHYEQWHFWGMRRPSGQIDFQVASQQMRNAFERYQRLVLERAPGFDAIDPSSIDPNDLEKFMAGELNPVLRFSVGTTGKIGDFVQRVGAAEVPRTLYEGLQYLDRQDPGESGVSDADRANVTSSPRTLGEIEMAQQGADTQKQWAMRQYAAFLSRMFYKINWIAAKHHTAPTVLSIEGRPTLFNDPGDPRSNLGTFMSPASRPLVTEDAMTWMSPLQKAQIAQGKWMSLLQDPYLNPIEVRKELIRGYGEKEPERFIMEQQPMMGTPDGSMEATPAGP